MNAQSEGEQEQGGGYRGGEKRQSKVVSTSLRILRGSDWHITASGKAAARSAAVVLRLGNGRMCQLCRGNMRSKVLSLIK